MHHLLKYTFHRGKEWGPPPFHSCLVCLTLEEYKGQFPRLESIDYGQYIENLHDHFDQPQPTLIVGDSTDPKIQQQAALYGPYDVVYIDGCHEYDYVYKDLSFYPTLLREGGLLVIDDSACDLRQPKDFFQGLPSVCLAVRTVIELDPQWEHLMAVIHNRIWRKQCKS